MTKRKRLYFVCFSVLMLFMFTFLHAQRMTGSLAGVVSDEEGATLPGVEVSIVSPSLMGTQSFVTRDDGSFRFPAIPPGRYVITVRMTGFQTVERPGVIVNVGTTTTVNFALSQAVEAEEITVIAASPVVDTKSSKLTSIFTGEFLANIPVGRDVYSVVQTAPSVIGDTASMVSVHGSVLMQSRYVLDGVDITDPLRGYRSTWLTFEAVEEVEMVLGGQGAENAKSSGGFINVVTKSGGNKLTAGITATYTDENFYKSAYSEEDLDALGLGLPTFNNYEYDLSATVGGPIMKDRLWFFLNPRYLGREMTPVFVPFTAGTGEFFDAFSNVRKQWLGFAKFTFQVSDSLKWTPMIHYYDANENPYSWWNTPKRAWTRSHDYNYTAWTVSNVLSFVIDQNTFTDLKVGYVRIDQINLDFYETGDRPLEMQATDAYYGHQWGLIPWNEDYARRKVDLDWNLTRFLDDFMGANHEVKIGAGYTWWKTRTSYYSAANYYEYWWKGTPWRWNDVVPYMGQYWIENFGRERDSIGPQLAEAQRYGFFFQDIVSVGEKLTLNLGLRYDRIAVHRPEETRLGWFDEWGNGLANLLAPDIFLLEDLTAPEIKNAMIWNKLQPRIGLTYDPFGDGKTALKAHWARMMDDVVGDMTAGLHPFDPWGNALFVRWWDDDHDGKADLPPIDRYLVLERPVRYITDPDELSEALDPDLSAPFVDEFTVGINREVVKDLSVGVTYIYRHNKNIMDTLDTNNPLDSDNWLPYTVTEPGPDAIMGTSDDAQLTVYGLRSDAPWQQRLMTNVDEAVRKYQGLELVVNKRMSNGWQLSGSLVYSKTYGNMGGGWGIWRGDRGGYLNPNQLVNRTGRTNFDRPLVIKLMGTAILPLDIVLSGYFRHVDGGPGSRSMTVFLPSVINGVPNRTPNVGVLAAPPGEFRGPAVDMLDLRLEKVFNLPVGRFGIYVDAFNVLGYKSLAVVKNNGGYIYADGSFSQFPTYGNINAASGVRSYLFTFRFSY